MSDKTEGDQLQDQQGPFSFTAAGQAGERNILQDYLEVVRQYRWLVISSVLVVLSAAAAYSFLSTPIYRAGARLLVEPAQLNIAPVQDVYNPTDVARDFQSRREYLETQLELIRSSHILRKAFDHFNFAGMEPFVDSKEPLDDFRDLVSVNMNRNTYLMDISFEWKDPVLASKVANYIASVYVQDSIQRRGGVSGGALEKLRAMLQQVSRTRGEALQALIDFKNKNQIIALDDSHKLLIESISNLTEALVGAEEEEAVAWAAVESVRQWRASGGEMAVLPEAMESNAVALFKVERLKAQAKLIELLVDFGARHRAVQAQRRVIAEMDQAIQEEIKTAYRRAELQLERAKMRTASIRAKLDDSLGEIKKLDTVSGHYRLLEDSLQAEEQSYRMILKRISELEVMESTGKDFTGGLIQVIVPATPPRTAAYPRKGLNLALGLMVGLLLGLGLAFTRYYLDSSVKTPEQVQRLIGGNPILGSVPKLSEGQDELVALSDPQSMISESFQTLRTSLGLSVMGRNKRAFMVSSAGPGEGKTLTSINLSIAMAREGRRTLLIEADMRRPRLFKVFGRSRTDEGLSNVLVGSASMSNLVSQSPDMPTLHYLLAGPTPPTPSELLSSEAFKRVMAEALKSYDMIIFDAPPVLSVADPSILAGLGIPMILVVRVFTTDRKLLSSTYKQIQTIQGRMVGAVLNSVDVPARGYYGYSPYYYYYSHDAYYRSEDEADNDRQGKRGSSGKKSSRRSSAKS